MKTISYMMYPCDGSKYQGKKSQVQWMEIPLPDVENGWHKIAMTKDDQYFTWWPNSHHWTTEYTWNKFLPMICPELDIEFHPEEFVLVENRFEQWNLDYHHPIQDEQYKITGLSNGDVVQGDWKVFRLERGSKLAAYPSAYHELWRHTHASALVENLTTQSNKTLVLNTSSFDSTVVPILAHYFKKILVIDARDNKQYGFRKIMDEMKPDYMVNLFCANCDINQKKWNQINK